MYEYAIIAGRGENIMIEYNLSVLGWFSRTKKKDGGEFGGWFELYVKRNETEMASNNETETNDEHNVYLGKNDTDAQY